MHLIRCACTWNSKFCLHIYSAGYMTYCWWPNEAIKLNYNFPSLVSKHCFGASVVNVCWRWILLILHLKSWVSDGGVFLLLFFFCLFWDLIKKGKVWHHFLWNYKKINVSIRCIIFYLLVKPPPKAMKRLSVSNGESHTVAPCGDLSLSST